MINETLGNRTRNLGCLFLRRYVLYWLPCYVSRVTVGLTEIGHLRVMFLPVHLGNVSFHIQN